MEGRVEIFYDNEWGTVCDDIWDLKDAFVVCRQLGYPVAIRRVLRAGFGEGSGRIWLDDVACAGNERNLSECMRSDWGHTNCNHGEDAGVICGGQSHRQAVGCYVLCVPVCQRVLAQLCRGASDI